MPETESPPVAGNPDKIPATLVFAEALGTGGVLTVGTEHGDVVIHADFPGQRFCKLVLTTDDALTLGMWLSAHIVDERRRWSAARGSGAPCATEQTLRQLADLNGTAGTRDKVRGKGAAGPDRPPQDGTERLGIIMTLTLVAIGNFASAMLAAMLVVLARSVP